MRHDAAIVLELFLAFCVVGELLATFGAIVRLL